MTYSETTEWLFSQLPNYQLQGGSAYKPGLDAIRRLLSLSGNPEKELRFIHVAGTNGKGSVSHMLASIFMENGYKTGLFTSPHLHDFRERIKINGLMVNEEFVVQFVAKHKEEWAEINPSFFEITTAMAFDAFRENGCDICIVETGLGGRLDSTNVITPEISIITNIGLDHTAFLGDTLEKIAFEKAGIIKPGVPVVVGEVTNETKPVFEKIAAANNSALLIAPKLAWLETDLAGSFQQRNAATVMTAVQKLRDLGWNLTAQKTLDGLRNVSVTTNFKGRFQKIAENPTVIVDAAHNADGVKILFFEIMQLQFEKLHLVYGAANDKDINEIFKLFPKDACYYFSEFDSKRTVKTDAFRKLAHDFKLNADFFSYSGDAIAAAYEYATERDLIVVFGSFYLIQEILPSPFSPGS